MVEIKIDIGIRNSTLSPQLDCINLDPFSGSPLGVAVIDDYGREWVT